MLLQQLNNCFPKGKATNLKNYLWSSRASQMALLVKKKKSACQCRRHKRQEDVGSIPGQGKSPGVGNGNPLQYSCLENSTDRGNWWATIMGCQRVGHNWVKEQWRSTDVHTNDIQIFLYPPPHLSIVTWSYHIYHCFFWSDKCR